MNEAFSQGFRLLSRAGKVAGFALALLGLVFSPWVVCAQASGGRPAPAKLDTSTDVLLEILEMTPIITPDTTDFSLRTRLTNRTKTALEGTLELAVSPNTPVTRLELSGWMENQKRKPVLSQVSSLPVSHVVAGGSQILEFRLPVGQLPLGSINSWGPRPLEVSFKPAKTGEESGKTVDETSSARSFLLWDSGASFEPSQLLALTPLAATGADVLDSAQVLPNLASRPSPRMQAVCALAAKAPLTLALDPLLLDPKLQDSKKIEALLGIEDPPTDKQSQDNHQKPAPSLISLIQQGKCGAKPLAYLPPGDYAAANAAHLDASSRSDLNQAASDLAQRLSGSHLPSDYLQHLLLWPNATHSPYLPQPVFSAEVEAWGTTHPLVVEAGANFQASAQPRSFDPDARHEITLGEDTTTLGWVADGEISSLMNGEAQLKTSGGIATLSPVAQRQWALASTAVLTRQRPFGPRLFVATLARDYSANPTQSQVARGLAQARWLTFPSWTQVAPDNRLKGSIPTQRPLNPADFSAISEGKNPARTLVSAPAKQIADNLAASRALANALKDGRAFSRMFSDLQVRSMCSTCLNTFPDGELTPGNLTPGRSQTNPATSQDVALIDPDVSLSLLHAVKAQPASVINLIDKEAQIPISVSNRLDEDITVRVVLKASDTRLQVENAPELVVPASSIASTHIPVKAVGHGDVTVTVALQNTAGQYFGASERIQVRVRAQWESTGTYILAALLALVLVFGIVRRMRKGRRRVGHSASGRASHTIQGVEP